MLLDGGGGRVQETNTGGCSQHIKNADRHFKPPKRRTKMRTRTRLWLWPSVAAILGMACVCGQRWAGASALTAAERASVQGGNIGCIKTVGSCTDPNGMPSVCTYNMMGQYCYMCGNANVPYSACLICTNCGQTCTTTIGPSSPWCGREYTGQPTGGPGTCLSGDCGNSSSTNCGVQIGTVTGDTCAP
jgi:hypothetical protein